MSVYIEGTTGHLLGLYTLKMGGREITRKPRIKQDRYRVKTLRVFQAERAACAKAPR